MPTLHLHRQVTIVDDTPGIQAITEAHPKGWAGRRPSFGGGGTTGWLAKLQLAPPGARFDLDREFQQPTDREVARSGKGLLTYELENDCIYEAESVWRSQESHRVFFVVEGNRIRILDDKVAAKRLLEAWQQSAPPPGEG